MSNGPGSESERTPAALRYLTVSTQLMSKSALADAKTAAKEIPSGWFKKEVQSDKE